MVFGATFARAQDPYGSSFGGPPIAANEGFAAGEPTSATLSPAANSAPVPATSISPQITGEIFEPGEVLATVGDQFILAADVLPHVNQVLEPYQDKMPAEQFQQQRRVVIAQITGAHVEVKLLYLAFLRKIPADKVKEIHKKVQVNFDKDLEDLRKKAENLTKEKQGELIKSDPQLGRLVLLMKDAGVWSPGELDALLRKYGGSLAQEKQYYAEFKLGRAAISQGLNFQPEISHDQMLAYYQEHELDYQFPTRVRFEIMSVRFANFPTKEAANHAICNMGNEVHFGAQFAAVAKRSSQGLNAEKGGYHDWTGRGSLASKPIEEALFALPVQLLSTVIEDDRGYHIVRVLDRQEAGKLSFEEVQIEIRKKLTQELVTKQYKEMVVSLKGGTKVWTTFDADPLLSQAISGKDRKNR